MKEADWDVGGVVFIRGQVIGERFREREKQLYGN